jgi:hypothetical protein
MTAQSNRLVVHCCKLLAAIFGFETSTAGRQIRFIVQLLVLLESRKESTTCIGIVSDEALPENAGS